MSAALRPRLIACLIFMAQLAVSASAAPPTVFHTPSFESPVLGGPDDLLFLGGVGFHAEDRVVYQEIRQGMQGRAHPTEIPGISTRQLGTAAVIQVGDPAYSLTIRLPEIVDAQTPYRLWVVNAHSEWSEPFTINDPRPLWIAPAYSYMTADIADVGRRIRVIGRNLHPPGSERAPQLRLQGPQTYILTGLAASQPTPASHEYIVEGVLPTRLLPGDYKVSVGSTQSTWTDVPDQRFVVLSDPPARPRFDLSDARFGSCRPDDGQDDSPCLANAITVTRAAGGGIIHIPAGRWDLYPRATAPEAEFILTPDISLEGAGADKTTLARRIPAGSTQVRAQPLLLLESSNSITRLKFTDERRFTQFNYDRAVIQLGHGWHDTRVAQGILPAVVRDIVISQNVFRSVNIGVADAGLPIEHLWVTHNDFGGYGRGMHLIGSGHSARALFRIDDAVIRWNRFVPGSYTDVAIHQGTIAAEMGASRRVDLSANEVDGTSTEALQDPDDPPGFRAAFFWNMDDSPEMLLVADNRITCPGDKAGDGEAIAFDGNNDTFGYNATGQVIDSGASTVTVKGELQPSPHEWAGGPDSYYIGHWMQVVEGPGLGQTRKIRSYHSDPSTGLTVFQVYPAWDVRPAAGAARVIVTRQFWQTYVVGNEINQAAPPCKKANLNGPRGGEINMWAPSADSLFAGNRQLDTNGLGYQQIFSSHQRSCPTCDSHSAVQTGLEIRGNQVLGEYDWSSSCSLSGIHGLIGASPTPEAPAPILSFGVQIMHNTIEHADGLHGGAIDIVPTWFRGTEPLRPLVANTVLAHNTITDIGGAPPRDACRYGQRPRSGIHIEGAANVRGTVLYKNSCEKVDKPLDDEGAGTLRVCDADERSSCECAPRR